MLAVQTNLLLAGYPPKNLASKLFQTRKMIFTAEEVCTSTSSLLYSSLLGGTQARLGITQAQERSNAQITPSRTHLVPQSGLL